MKSSRCGRSTGKSFAATARTRPGRFAVGVELVQDRERLAPEALPAEEPVAELVVHRLAADALRGEVGGDLAALNSAVGEAVVLAGVDRDAVAGEAVACRRGLRRAPPAATASPGSTTGMIGRSNCWANSKSRSSCAGTAMIAPVP